MRRSIDGPTSCFPSSNASPISLRYSAIRSGYSVHRLATASAFSLSDSFHRTCFLHLALFVRHTANLRLFIFVLTRTQSRSILVTLFTLSFSLDSASPLLSTAPEYRRTLRTARLRFSPPHRDPTASDSHFRSEELLQWGIFSGESPKLNGVGQHAGFNDFNRNKKKKTISPHASLPSLSRC